jgi:transcription antitermination factor NusG
LQPACLSDQKTMELGLTMRELCPQNAPVAPEAALLPGGIMRDDIHLQHGSHLHQQPLRHGALPTASLSNEAAAIESAREDTPPEGVLRWFAVTVKHHHERTIETVLQAAGMETFVPTYLVRRQWSDRIKEMENPLFPGYIFGRFHLEERIRVLNVPGVGRIVGFGGVPVPLTDGEVGDLRAAVASRLPLSPWPRFKPGDRVRVERGPLRGVEGTLLREKGGLRLIVGVELLQRYLAVELEPEMLAPASIRPQQAVHASVFKAGLNGYGGKPLTTDTRRS